jgi:hypothetical protein
MLSLPTNPLLLSLYTAGFQHLHPCRTTGSAKERTKQQVQHTSTPAHPATIHVRWRRSLNATHRKLQMPQTADATNCRCHKLQMPQTTTIKCNA